MKPFRTKDTKKHNGVALVVLFLLLSLGKSHAATINAASVSLAHVTDAMNTAVNGDTVAIPAGTATWTAALTVSKRISIIGAGIDATVIIASLSGRTHRRTFTLSTSNGSLTRLSGFSIRGISGQAGDNEQIIYMTGGSHQFRIDHIKITGLAAALIKTNGDLWGVIDHCEFELPGTSNITLGHGTWPAPGGIPAANGDGSWADDPHFGTEKFIFIEDCIFTGPSLYNIDAENGARYVFRYNQASGLIGGHGTESGQLKRGTRAAEVYWNVSNRTGQALNDKPLHVRSGSYVVHNNRWIAWNNKPAALYYRGTNTFTPWGGSNGINPWDDNDPTIYGSGTVSAASSGLSVTVPIADATTNQFARYVIRNTTSSQKPGFSQIASNTASAGGTCTVTYLADSGYSGQVDLNFATGAGFEIRKVLAGLDAPARGKGDLLTGGLTDKRNTVTGTPSWPRNALEGIYYWDNVTGATGNTPSTFSYGGIPSIGGGFFATAKPDYTPYQYPHPLVSGAPPLVTLPVNITPPVIIGEALVGRTLSFDAGIWETDNSAPESFSYGWDRCDSGGGNCAQVATTTTYALTVADDGSRIKLREIATNSAGNATATSATTAIVTTTTLPVPTLRLRPTYD